MIYSDSHTTHVPIFVFRIDSGVRNLYCFPNGLYALRGSTYFMNEGFIATGHLRAIIETC